MKIASKCSFEVCCTDDVPRGLWGDPTRIRQIVFNLSSNAIKFTHTGAVRVSVSCEGVEDETACIRIEVRDSGIGIPQEVRTTIFEKFTQADASMTRRFGGTGLGLAIMHALVKHMQGHIYVESREGHGSTFTAELPLRLAKAEDIEAPVLAEGPERSRSTEARVLRVEDNRVNQCVMCRLIEKLGCQVDVADQEIRFGIDGLSDARDGWLRCDP